MATATHDIIVVGASAGGVEALRAIVADLPGDLPASIFAVLHFSARVFSVLPEILTRAGPLPAVHPKDQEPIQRGKIYLAPPDYHLLLAPGHVHVIHGPRENRWRPAIDPLFRSAALVYGPRVIGVVLTGMLDDGAAGLSDVRRRGGLAVIQDPADANFPSMPLSALRYVKTPHRPALKEIAPLLSKLARETAAPEEGYPVPKVMALENRIAAMEANTVDTLNELGTPSGYACPECFGPLWKLDGVDIPRFRCHTGHAFSPESLIEAQAAYAEDSLWRVLQSTDERIHLMREMARRAREDDVEPAALRWDEEIKRLERLSEFVKDSLTSSNGDRKVAGAPLNGGAAPKLRKPGGAGRPQST